MVQGPSLPPLPISRSGKSRIHDKRATSLSCAHIQVCARDNKFVTCPRCLMQRLVLNRHRQGKKCNRVMPCWPQDTTLYTHQYPNHIPVRSSFTFPSFYHECSYVITYLRITVGYSRYRYPEHSSYSTCTSRTHGGYIYACSFHKMPVT